MNQYVVFVGASPNRRILTNSACTSEVVPSGAVQMNVTIFGATFGHIESWLDSLQICDSDNAASLTGNSAEEAGVDIGKYYMTAPGHLEAPGGIPKKRLV